jgi:predicted transcriptional regulator
MEVLNRLEEPSTQVVFRIVNKALDKPVCERTIWRDLATLGSCGFVQSRRVSRDGGGQVMVHKLTTPKAIVEMCKKVNAGEKIH